jgi:hypothetical protein
LHRGKIKFLFSFLNFLSLLQPNALAQADDNSVENQVTLRTVGTFSENPNNTSLFGYNSESSNKFILRDSFKYKATPNLRFELNIYNLSIGSTDKTSASQLILTASDEKNRSPKLEHHWHDSHKIDGYLTIDRINVKGTLAGTEFAIGRFPISMSTTAIFTPNDFFAPYRPYNYYREYKPGVDAIRLDHELGKKGQLSVMGVAGYSSELATGNIGRLGIKETKDPKYSPEEASAIARMSYTFGGFETALLGGKLGQYNMGGFTLQGEIADIGIRAEGHQKGHRKRDQSSSEVAAGVDYRLTESLLIQIEQFFHGAGYSTVDDYDKVQTDPDPPIFFLGQNYSALAASYDITPLVVSKSMVIGNLTDHSALISANITYSLADNAEFSASYLLPRGRGAEGTTLRSEYGIYPRIFTLETGIYW